MPILEDQGLALEKINVLARLIANSDGDGALNVLPACILDGLVAAEARRTEALETRRGGGASARALSTAPRSRSASPTDPYRQIAESVVWSPRGSSPCSSLWRP